MKKLNTLLTLATSLFLFSSSSANSADAPPDLATALREVIKREQLKPLKFTRDSRSAKFRLGAKLFADNKLSGNNNISCMTCHHPMLGTSDELPLSIGEGGTGMGRSRQLDKGRIIARHASHLFNLGFPEMTEMFWDGRVSHDPDLEIFYTPEKLLNGPTPYLSHYTEVLSSALSAQAMFPPLSHDEMRGEKGSNEIADAKNNVEAWEKLTKRIVNDERYPKLFVEAFNVENMDEVNFAHIAEALGHFQANMFAITNTAFDRYVAGDNSAMSPAQKRGALLFYGSARCVQCHSGMNFTDNLYHNTGFPQVGPGKESLTRDDLGRYNVTKREEDLYTFKTPSLRNVEFSAPYGHSGSLRTLEQVVLHYTHPMRSNHHYNPGFRSLPYKLDLQTENMNDRLRRVDPIIGRMGIFISVEDRADLVEFLKSLSMN